MYSHGQGPYQAALDLIDLDLDWAAYRGTMSVPDRAARLVGSCSGAGPAMVGAIEGLARHAELQGAEAARCGRELPYHNRTHIHDVLLGWSLLSGTGTTGLEADARLLVMAAMIGHDLLHDGTSNQHPYQLEKRAWHDMATLLRQAGIGLGEQRAIMAIVLATDPKSYARLTARAVDSTLHRCFRLAIGSDLFASLLPRTGFAAGSLLAREGRSAGLGEGSDRLATLEGRGGFLRVVPRLGRMFEACGMELLIDHQLKVIGAMPRADRLRPWDAAWGEAFGKAVQASLVQSMRLSG